LCRDAIEKRLLKGFTFRNYRKERSERSETKRALPGPRPWQITKRLTFKGQISFHYLMILFFAVPNGKKETLGHLPLFFQLYHPGLLKTCFLFITTQ